MLIEIKVDQKVTPKKIFDFVMFLYEYRHVVGVYRHKVKLRNFRVNFQSSSGLKEKCSFYFFIQGIKLFSFVEQVFLQSEETVFYYDSLGKLQAEYENRVMIFNAGFEGNEDVIKNCKSRISYILKRWSGPNKEEFIKSYDTSIDTKKFIHKDEKWSISWDGGDKALFKSFESGNVYIVNCESDLSKEGLGHLKRHDHKNVFFLPWTVSNGKADSLDFIIVNVFYRDYKENKSFNFTVEKEIKNPTPEPS